MSNEQKLQERWARIEKAINLEKPDRVPVILLYALFSSKITGQPFFDFCTSIQKSSEAMLKAYDMCGDADGMDYLGFATYGLCFMWMSKVKVPGIDLPADVSYQMAEAELMKKEDYDVILDKGWPEFFNEYMMTRVLKDVNPDYLPFNQPPFDAKTAADPMGIPILTAGAPIPSPFDMLCGARSMPKFVHDMYTIPDKVDEVMKLMIDGAAKPVLDMSVAGGYKSVWIGGWRAASEMLAPKLWQRFVWPYYRQIVMEAIDAGLTPTLHLDSDWTRDLEFFKELPPKKVIFSTDGRTDIFKAKEVLGDRFCIMGDVPPALLSMGTPDKVHEYCTKLIKEIGPEGFILHSGCDIPLNAKLENVQAMVESVKS